jgi:hypothetical protein
VRRVITPVSAMISLVIALGLSAHTASTEQMAAQSGPLAAAKIDISEYMPLTVGSTWSYTKSVKKAQSTRTSSTTWHVTEMIHKTDQDYYVCEDKDGQRMYVCSDSKGWRYYGHSWRNMDYSRWFFPEVRIPNGLATGSSGRQVINVLGNEADWPSRIAVVYTIKKSSPYRAAGKAFADVIKVTLSETIPGDPTEIGRWEFIAARDVGVVWDSVGGELVSYHVARGK